VSGWRTGAQATLALRIVVDILVVAVALWLAFLLRFDGTIPTGYIAVLWRAVVLAMGLKIPVFMVFRTHRFSWRHVGLSELYWSGVAVVVGSLLLASVAALALHNTTWGNIPRSVLAIDFLLTGVGIIGVRVSHRLVAHLRSRRTTGSGRRALVVGAGDAGAQLVRAIQEEPSSAYCVIGLVDDDPTKQQITVHGARVLGTREHLGRLIASREIVTVLIAMPTASAAVLRDTVERVRQAGVTDVKILPSLSELYTGRVTAAELREVHPEDLLNRDPVSVDETRIERFLAGRTILITGAAGSIGSELCRQVMRYAAETVVALDVNETGLFDLDAEIRRRFPKRAFRVEIADVREETRMAEVFERIRPHVVFHAAAYKHVPLMEAFPAESVKTNVTGTRLVLEAACRQGADAFVFVSTDKAVNPTSVMGATKRVAEMLVKTGSSRGETCCLAVRFGNVLGSRGSVLKTFTDQIEHRRPVTVTHPEITRYFMITSEAAQLVLQAGVIGQNGDVLVLDMGTPTRMVDMARDLIRLHGLEPDRDIPIVYTGLRPGEKLYEELLTAKEGTEATTHGRVFVARIDAPPPALIDSVTELESVAAQGDGQAVRDALQRLVPTYRPNAQG